MNTFRKRAKYEHTDPQGGRDTRLLGQSKTDIDCGKHFSSFLVPSFSEKLFCEVNQNIFGDLKDLVVA